MAAAVRHSALQATPTWPFIGREDELAWLDAARREEDSLGVVMSGAAGVGKTRLAREVLAAASKDGVPTEWVQATAAAASIPLGAFAALVPSGVRTDDRLQLFQLCTDALRERAPPDRVVLGVDDAHLLDPTSAALVLHVATTRTAFVVATVRAGEPCPDSIVALWKDLSAPRLELQQLSADETGELLEAALGGDVARGLKLWAYGASEGHALYLRELVKGALASGALVKDGARWELRGQPSVSPALVDLISARLAGLDGDQLDAVRLLALAEPVAVSAAVEIADRSVLSVLEQAGLVVVTSSLPQAEVRLSHPLYSEVVRASLPSLRGDELRLRLAETLRAQGFERPGDALRAATLLQDAGATIDEPLLLAAARDANAASEPDPRCGRSWSARRTSSFPMFCTVRTSSPGVSMTCPP